MVTATPEKDTQDQRSAQTALRTCNDELRKRYLEARSVRFEIKANQDDFTAWLEQQPKYRDYIANKEELNRHLKASERAMEELAALGNQYELQLDL